MSFHVIKENDLFYLSNGEGIIPSPPENDFGYGLYAEDTRVLSELNWTFTPWCWRAISADSSNNYESVYRYTNTAFQLADGTRIPDQSCLVTRRQFVDGRGFYERTTLANYSGHELPLTFVYRLRADFADMFEVRGVGSKETPRHVVCEVGTGQLGATFTYISNEGTVCKTQVKGFRDKDVALAIANDSDAVTMTVSLSIPPHSERNWGIGVFSQITALSTLSEASRYDDGAATLEVLQSVETSSNDNPAQSAGHRPPSQELLLNHLATSRSHLPLSGNVLEMVDDGRRHMEDIYRKWFFASPRVTGNEFFQTWYERGLRDLRMLMTDIGYGEFPVAGVPWFAVPFGRDSIITSIQMMMANPRIAKGTLQTMAHFQGTAINPVRDEQPGKIMHELRVGELTRTGRVPFDPYYGTIDATPLFLNLAADYYAWTGDKDFIKDLLPVVRKAFSWIEQYGDRDGDGFVEYLREAENGIANQGWKDSGDSVMHQDGTLAHGSIALCEVQGYVYRAYREWQHICERIGERETAEGLNRRANILQKRFMDAFWMEGERSIAIGLDGLKRQIQSVSSNMGQVLWSGILPKEHADKVIDRLLEPDMNSGFGIRTLSADSLGYNPISYHNGSVWPHDNSMIIAGMARYNRIDAVHEVIHGLMRAGEGFSLYRLPELFSGISAREVKRPVPYPVSCSPQAWAAATPIFVLQALLGIVPDVTSGRVVLSPSLPEYVPHLRIEGIPVGRGRLSVDIERAPNGCTQTKVLSNDTGIEVFLSPVGEVMPAPQGVSATGKVGVDRRQGYED